VVKRLSLLAEADAALRSAADRSGELLDTVTQSKTGDIQTTNPAEHVAKSWLSRVDQLKQYVADHPAEKIPEFKFLTDREWLMVADAGLKNGRYSDTS